MCKEILFIRFRDTVVQLKLKAVKEMTSKENEWSESNVVSFDDCF